MYFWYLSTKIYLKNYSDKFKNSKHQHKNLLTMQRVMHINFRVNTEIRMHSINMLHINFTASIQKIAGAAKSNGLKLRTRYAGYGGLCCLSLTLTAKVTIGEGSVGTSLPKYHHIIHLTFHWKERPWHSNHNCVLESRCGSGKQLLLWQY